MQAEAWTIAFLLSGLLCILAGWLTVRYLGSRVLTTSLLSLYLASPLILEKVRDGVVLLDVQDRILHVNGAALSILEINASSAGEPLENLFRPSSETALHLMRSRAGRWDFQEKTASGDKWLDMTFSPLIDKKGRLRGQVVIFRDITKRKRAQLQLEVANLELKTRNRELDRHNYEARTLHEMSSQLQICASVGETAPIIRGYMQLLLPVVAGGIYIYSAHRQLMELNIGWPEDVALADGFDSGKCRGWTIGEVCGSGDGGVEQCFDCKGRLAGTSYICQPLAVDGAPFAVLHFIYPTGGLNHHQQQMLVTAIDTIKLALLNLQMQENLRQESIRDPLTSLFNRRYMEEALQSALYNAQRNGRPLSVIMADIDNFKQINDRFGHRLGDQALLQVSQLFLGGVRRNDIACRYGGDEFILVMPDAPLESAYARADTLRRALNQQSANQEGGSEQISLSLGVAAFPQHGQTVEALIEAADKALYLAKQGGRNQIRRA